MQRASYMPWNSSSKAQNITLDNVSTSGAAAYGWGPENNYVTTLNEHGVWVHASDYSKNLAALANAFMNETNVPRTSLANAFMNEKNVPRASHSNTMKSNRHTVAFLMSDGDNLQWTMGPWSTSENWYGSKSRGKLAMGWTLSPALVDIAPALVSRVHWMKTDNDEFIAGPSGYGTFLSLSLSLSLLDSDCIVIQ